VLWYTKGQKPKLMTSDVNEDITVHTAEA